MNLFIELERTISAYRKIKKKKTKIVNKLLNNERRAGGITIPCLNLNYQVYILIYMVINAVVP